MKIRLSILLYTLVAFSSAALLALPVDAGCEGKGTGKKKGCNDATKSATCDDKNTVCIDVANVSTTGDKIRGPVTVKLDNVNRLRYDVNMSETVTFTSGPDLSKLGFIPPVGAELPQEAGKKEEAPIKPKGEAVPTIPPPIPHDLNHAFDELSGKLPGFIDEFNNARKAVSGTVDLVNKISAEVANTVRASDATLQAQGGKQVLLQSVHDLGGDDNNPGKIGTALASSWPADAIAVTPLGPVSASGGTQTLNGHFDLSKLAAGKYHLLATVDGKDLDTGQTLELK